MGSRLRAGRLRVTGNRWRGVRDRNSAEQALDAARRHTLPLPSAVPRAAPPLTRKPVTGLPSTSIPSPDLVPSQEQEKTPTRNRMGVFFPQPYFAAASLLISTAIALTLA